MPSQTFQPKIINNHPVFQRKFEELMNTPMYKDMGDFFEGIFVSFEEEDFDPGVLFDQCYFSMVDGDCVFTFMKEYMKDPMIHFKFPALNQPTKEGTVSQRTGNYVAVRGIFLSFMFNKPLFYDKNVIGSIKFFSSMDQSAKFDYNFGKTFGKQISRMVTLVDNDFEKEVFDSIVMYLLSRYKSSKSKSKGKLDIKCGLSDSSSSDSIQLSISGANHEHFIFSTWNPEVLSYHGKEFLITPDFLKELRSGRLNKKAGKYASFNEGKTPRQLPDEAEAIENDESSLPKNGYLTPKENIDWFEKHVIRGRNLYNGVVKDLTCKKFANDLVNYGKMEKYAKNIFFKRIPDSKDFIGLIFDYTGDNDLVATESVTIFYHRDYKDVPAGKFVLGKTTDSNVEYISGNVSQESFYARLAKAMQKGLDTIRKQK